MSTEDPPDGPKARGAATSSRNRVVLRIIVVMMAGTIAVIAAVAVMLYVKKRREAPMLEERSMIMRTLQDRIVARCEAGERWAPRSAGPVGPGFTRTFSEDSQFARLGLDLPAPQHNVFVARNRRVLGGLKLAAIGRPDGRYRDRFTVSICERVTASGGGSTARCRCRRPLITGAPDPSAYGPPEP